MATVSGIGDSVNRMDLSIKNGLVNVTLDHHHKGVVLDKTLTPQESDSLILALNCMIYGSPPLEREFHFEGRNGRIWLTNKRGEIEHDNFQILIMFDLGETEVAILTSCGVIKMFLVASNKLGILTGTS